MLQQLLCRLDRHIPSTIFMGRIGCTLISRCVYCGRGVRKRRNGVWVRRSPNLRPARIQMTEKQLYSVAAGARCTSASPKAGMRRRRAERGSGRFGLLSAQNIVNRLRLGSLAARAELDHRPGG